MIKRERFIKRKTRVRARVEGSRERPRLSVFRSNKFLYAQIIDDAKGQTLISAKGIKKEAESIGEEIAKRAKTKKITKVVFDRRGYKYHGHVKALAEGARKGGLGF